MKNLVPCRDVPLRDSILFFVSSFLSHPGSCLIPALPCRPAGLSGSVASRPGLDTTLNQRSFMVFRVSWFFKFMVFQVHGFSRAPKMQLTETQ
jgi:hypothetical protein